MILNNVKLLIVDDHLVVRNGIKMLINSVYNDMSVMEASSGKEALLVLKSNEVDILLTDLNMKEGSGIELIEAAKKDFPKVKIIVLSMHTDSKYIKECISLGASGYISKNMENDNELIKALEEVARGNNYYGYIISQEIIKTMFENEKTQLTSKEIEIIKYIAEGLLYKQIADKMGISKRTVETHRNNIISKLNALSNADIIKYAIKNDLVTLS